MNLFVILVVLGVASAASQSTIQDPDPAKHVATIEHTKLFTAAQEAQLVENTKVGWAPVIEPLGEPALSAGMTNKTYRPAVIVHGMGDSGTNAGMPVGFLQSTVSD